MSILVLLFAVVLFSSNGLSQLRPYCKICPKDFTYFSKENKCYKAFANKENWEDATETCAKRKAHLAIIKSASDNKLLEKVIDQLKGGCVNKFLHQQSFWTAGRRRCSITPFVWASKDGIRMDMNYTNWLPDEPDNLGGNTCLQIVVDKRIKLGWSDMLCDNENCFICEIDM